MNLCHSFLHVHPLRQELKKSLPAKHPYFTDEVPVLTLTPSMRLIASTRPLDVVLSAPNQIMSKIDADTQEAQRQLNEATRSACGRGGGVLINFVFEKRKQPVVIM